ncbi:hypothetical protein EIP86_001781 [Pleurotus ostreatoroseus]|nr:hypothetical protein EIP86_001781 [Pleurotus ostreatoroseus]
MPVTFHTLEDVSTAPEGVKKLVANLQRPLCGKQKLESLPSMTPLALAQLQRVQDQASDIGPAADTFDTISSVANLVLTTSATIEQLSRGGNGLEARSMVPHWYTLLRTIARASHPDVQITGYTPFIYPRGFGGEGIAEMLMSFAADKVMVGLNLEPEHSEHSDIDVTSSACAEDLCPLVEDHESISESGVDEGSYMDDDEEAMAYEEDDYSEDSYDEARDHPMFSAECGPLFDIRVPDEAELFFGLDAIDEHEPPEETWLDLPHWSHILAGRHSGSVVLFPVLCVAPETEIVPLMASAAYQRHAWGVDLPIVGLEISASSCSARVYISWVDPLSDVQHMPTVHIMHPMPDAATRTSDVLTLPGSFDLADPQSALALAHFVFSLDYQFEILQKELPLQRLRRFTWRSDDDATLWTGNIEEWRAHIDESDESRRSSGASESRIGTSKTQHDNDAQTTSTAEGSDAAQTDKKPPSSACSAFALRSLSNNIQDDKPSMMNWMLYRFVFTLTRTPGWNVIPDGCPPELLQNLQFYDNFTCLRWPKEWTGLDRVPQVDSCLAPLRAQLFDEYQAKLHEPSAELIPELEAPLASILATRLSLLLKNADSAYTKAARQSHALEIECRHDFDSLFMEFFVDDPNRPTSPEVFLECRLRLAQNTLLEHFRDQAAATDDVHSPQQLTKRLEAWLVLNQSIAREIRGRRLILHAARAEDKEVLRQQCLQAESGATDLSNQWAQLEQDDNFRDIVEEHSTMEPTSGICDAALVTTIPIPLNTATSDTQKAHQIALEQSQFLNLSPDQSQEEKPSDEPKQSRGGPKPDSNLLYIHPLGVPSGDYPPYHGPKVPSVKPHGASDDGPSLHILLPQLLIEYKRASQHERKALNQARIMNIDNYPVFGFAAHGQVGVLVMGWMSSNGAVYLLERNARRFDISQPIQAFHLATIVLRLKARETELRELFKKRAQAYLKDLSNGRFKPWAAEKPAKTEESPLTTIVESTEH